MHFKKWSHRRRIKQEIILHVVALGQGAQTHLDALYKVCCTHQDHSDPAAAVKRGTACLVIPGQIVPYLWTSVQLCDPGALTNGDCDKLGRRLKTHGLEPPFPKAL